MRNSWTAGAVILAVAMVASADTNRDRGKAAAQGVLTQWGSPDSLQNKAMTPLGSSTQMSSIDGSKSFGAQTTCEGAKNFLKLTLVPNGTGDIASMAVDFDGDLDGTPDQHTVLNGPYGAMCDNGMVQCDAGSMNNCHYFRWQADASSVSLNPNNPGGYTNTVKDMGACYCFNNSCGTSLLLVNADKILDDAGAGIAVALSQNVARFAMSGKTMLDSTSAQFFGQTSGCGTDQKPEQYFKNIGGLEAQGASNRSDPNSTYNKILTSSVSQGHGTTDQACQVNRNITMVNYTNDSVVQITLNGDGEVTSCGAGCAQVVVGKPGNNYLSASCGLWTTSANVVVNRPELISAVTLTEAGFDDWLRVRVNGNIVWNADPSWTSESARCGENGNRGTKSLNQDLTSYFKNVAPATTVQLRQDTSWDDKGEGYAVVQFHYNQDCQVQSETISDGCTSQENNSECSLKDEQVDGTQTIQGYTRTGLTPQQTSKTYTINGCSQTYTRDYFNKQRTYSCPTTASPYNGDAATKRYDSIHQSFDTSTGTYTDTTYSNGTYTSSAQQITNLMPPDTVAACPLMCRTQKPRPGVAVGEPGPTNQLNPNGVAYDYTWRECTESNACPSEAGETVVTACGCRNNFGEAAAAMQTIRQVSEDSLCQAQ